jgi:hypothetical protein
MTKTPQTLKEIFEHHLPYEIDRLAEAFELLKSPRELRERLSQSTFDTVADSLVVAFCIHGKNLIEFLSRPISENYASSSDYADNYQPWNIAHGTQEHSIKGKLNNQLSHLTFDRTTVDSDKISIDDRIFIVQQIKNELERWAPYLKTTYNVNALPIARLTPSQTVKLSGSISATNHTTYASSGPFGFTGPSGSHKK